MNADEFDRYILPTYGRFPITLDRAEGSYVYDTTGKKYLDFMSGWGVSNIGHRHPKVVSAAKTQLDQLIHVPNVFYTDAQGQLAKELVSASFNGKVFFSNSGAEANEAAIKFAKLHGNSSGRNEIITFNKSFHGRTAAAMAATGQQSISKGFDPLLDGFVHVDFNDTDALTAAITDKTAAIMLEFVQGEGGINIASPEFIETIASLREEHNLLVIADEVQTGMGRTGTLFAYQNFGLVPDILTLAKALANGLPIGATIVSNEASKEIKPGIHGSTFGGGAVIAQAARATLAETKSLILSTEFAQNIELLTDELSNLPQNTADIIEVRQRGMMIGIELNKPALPIMKHCLNNGLIVNATQETVLRLLPPLNTSKSQIQHAIRIISESLGRE